MIELKNIMLFATAFAPSLTGAKELPEYHLYRNRPADRFCHELHGECGFAYTQYGSSGTVGCLV